jgi:hypothetical protein
MDYKTARSLALKDVQQVYLQLGRGEIKYKNYKTKVKNIMRKYGSNYEKDEINNKKYYVQSFVAGDFDFDFVIDINVVDFKYENINNIDEVIKADFTTKCFVTCIDKGLVENFS